ncbi:MAG: chemotaxis protein CheB [Gemmataceae bacterium]
MATDIPAPENSAEANLAPGEPSLPAPRSRPFPIVGVGASAGGLEAFTELLHGLPAEPGMAFLFVQHLEPHRKSQLAQILSSATSMPVREATEGVRIEVNHVYILPPDVNMALEADTLVLTPRPVARGLNMPADHLFRSLATTQKARAVGVILSGGGTDGTLGFQSIKAEGGITFAQDEQSARQVSMPRAAQSDGNVDYVLPPVEIARELTRLGQHPYSREAGAPEPSPGDGEAVADILGLLRAGTGVDFTHYKPTTIKRRIQRRMALRSQEKLDEYVQTLRDDPPEVQALYQDLLIRVTQFFRDPEAFEAIKEKVFPRLVQNRPAGAVIRIWVAGCATGEEVYSLAISLLEFLGNRPMSFPIKILATDLNESALERARQGIYVDNIEIDVSPERLRRFFVRSNGNFQISKGVRDLCVFSRHNMAADPPFSRLDLVSCRNVLIYMDVALQKRVLPILHYSLHPEGYLLLGGSESVGSFTELFDTVDAKNRIFAKKATAVAAPLEFGSFPTVEGMARRPVRADGGVLWTALDVQKEADRIILGRFAPVGVVVDETATVVQFRGRTNSYLEPAPGLASLDLMRMLREGLLVEVRAAFNQAKSENAAVVKDGLRITDDNQIRHLRLEVIPFKVPPSGVRFFLVLFLELPLAPEVRPATRAEPLPTATEQQVTQLQQELAAVREYLQSVIEEHESTNEELRSANEEILSANEELQSTNEELQTAKEEAQSANEELGTVNEELNHRNAELAHVNNDLVNLLNGVNIPIVMVTRDLRIRRFTPPAEKVFNLIPSDVGRPISDIKPNLDVADLSQLIATVIDSLTPYEAEARDKANHTYALRIQPYVTLEQKIDGASVVLLELDALKKGLERPRSGKKDG